VPTYLYEDGTLIQFARSPGGKPPGGRVNGLKRKTFMLNSKHKRLIRSASIRLFLKKKHAILFCTLTFPKDIGQKEANRCFSNFTDNLKTNFKLNDYVAVKENTQRGRPHFHCLFDIPFTDYKLLNKSWCASFSQYMRGSPNAFTTGRLPIIRTVQSVAGYITKYITKTVQSQSAVKPESRQYFISKGTACKPALIPDWLREYLVRWKPNERYEGDFYTWYRLYQWECIPEDYLKEVDPPPLKRPKKRSKKPVISDADQLQIVTNLDIKVDLHYKF